MTGQTTANSSDTAMLLWPGTEWHVYELLGNDFNLDIVYVYSSSTAMYDVYDMEPAAGSVLERGSNVTVYVSLGDAQDAWSEWIDGNVPEYISGDYWWSDEYYKYYEYEEIEYRTVCRYRTKLMTVD